LDSRGFSFDREFEALTGHPPMSWQRRLFERHFAVFAPDNDSLPHALDIPTGLGKTSVIVVWLLSLAWQAQNGGVRLPRRLIYVVNRRTVVDQATDTAIRLREELRGATDEGPLDLVRKALSRLCIDPSDHASPLAISTLRGELADNREWQSDPARPAIIIGTVDMIGSRLLFSGYGDRSSYRRAQAAGLIGHDSLLIHDEAHLSPAFTVLISSIEAIQQQRDRQRPFRVMELSATQRAANRDQPRSRRFELTEEERKEDTVRQRTGAPKALHLNAVDANDLPDKIIGAALAHAEAKARVLVFIRTPELAEKIRDGIAKKVGSSASERVQLLTGTLRGKERDDLAAGALFREFKASVDRDVPEHTLFLVSTSAGEIGVDLDADHVVCDLTTLDSMIQRLGRVNRLGRSAPSFVARVDVFDASDDKGSDHEERRRKTAEALGALSVRADGSSDASPAALGRLLEKLGPDGRDQAFAAIPRVVPCTDILLDNWALTSVRKMPGRPRVDRWLHGIEADPPETIVVWRSEAADLAQLSLDENRWAETVDEWFDAHPILARERLRDRSDRVAKQIATIAKRHPGVKALLILSSHARRIDLADAADKDEIAGATLILAPERGGLSAGLLLGREEVAATDVADHTEDSAQIRMRIRLTRSEEEDWRVVVLGARTDDMAIRLTAFEADNERPVDVVINELLMFINSGLSRADRLVEREPRLIIAEDEAGAARVVISVGRAVRAETLFAASAAAPENQLLADHLDWAAIAASCVARRLGLSYDLARALELAARLHDRGKNRIFWQKAIGNPASKQALAKTDHGRWKKGICDGYRHELGSLIEIESDADITAMADSEQDLVLHLIASHHGWARPHFEPQAEDLAAAPEANATMMMAAMRRYARVQRRCGRWGLAWLEALMKAVDATASRLGRDVVRLAE
jgi:CRISPR-associated endonuclease/helicase Cas3